MHTYSTVALGGTFDHFHIGHQAFLTFAFQQSHHVIIGVTLPQLTHTKKYAETIESYETRIASVQKFCDEFGYRGRYTVIPLHDVYGTTCEDQTIEALVVTPLTLQGAHTINIMRQKKGMHTLPIMECALVKDDVGAYVSSTRIREGHIDRNGFVYANIMQRAYTCTEKQKETLRNFPAQHVQEHDLLRLCSKTTLPIILVGDRTTHTFLLHNTPFSIAYIDGHEQRKMMPIPAGTVDAHIDHPKGTLQPQTHKHLKHHMHEMHQIYMVNGEEDLLAVEAVFALPLGSMVFFGDPKRKCILCIYIDESIKKSIKEILTSSVFVQPTSLLSKCIQFFLL